jgi:hypothetical protein
VCYLAGVGDAYVAFERPDEAARANGVAPASVLGAAKETVVRKVV